MQPSCPPRSSPTADQFSTRDLFLGAWLVALGHSPSIAGPSHARTMTFASVPAADLDAFYRPEDSRVSAERLFGVYKSLRTRLLT